MKRPPVHVRGFRGGLLSKAEKAQEQAADFRGKI